MLKLKRNALERYVFEYYLDKHDNHLLDAVVANVDIVNMDSTHYDWVHKSHIVDNIARYIETRSIDNET